MMILMAIWRRWYGGGYKDTWLGNNRGIQCVVFILLNFLLLLTNREVTFFIGQYTTNIYIKYAFIAILDIYLYAQYWSRGHGAPFDIGRNKIPSEDTIRRYNERLYHYPLDWLFDKWFKRPDKKYGFIYDFLYMLLRYTCPMIPLAFIDINFLLVGLSVSPVYAFCWTVQEMESWIFERYKFAKSATNLAEYIVGAIYGFML